MSKESLDGRTYRKTTLANGLRIVTESIPYIRSVSMGIWVQSGSRFEEPPVNGVSHFIEHMLFKGTARRTAYNIAREIDSVGGVLNAFTSKEMTSFYCKVTDDNLVLAADLLTDIFLNSSFPQDEIDREKQVICQEIYQMEDTPEDLVHETLGMRFWRDDPLGQPIMGSVATIKGLERDVMMSFKDQAYTPAATVVCAAGKVDHDRFVDLIEGYMGGLEPGLPPRKPAPPTVRTSSCIVKRDLEQVHICLGAVGPSAVDERRHASYLLNTILGGGMSSRLFQEVREKSGLAYSVYSYLSSFTDTGIFGIYAACEPGKIEELLKIIRNETTRLRSTVTEEDIRTAKSQIKGNVILSMESSDSRMNRLAKGEYYFGRYISMDEVLSSLEKVTAEQISAVANEVINSGPFTLVAVGPLDEDMDILAMFEQ